MQALLTTVAAHFAKGKIDGSASVDPFMRSEFCFQKGEKAIPRLPLNPRLMTALVQQDKTEIFQNG
jgi:hypothetical protein